MKILFTFILGLSCLQQAAGQTYKDTIALYRKNYIAELLADKRAPIRAFEVKNISFFPADRNYCVLADFKASRGSVPFQIPTHSGKQKPFREYGTLTFTLNGTQYTLHAYQGINLLKEGNADYLFIPFKDLTNYANTYGGGRYIDLAVGSISNGKIVLDFNKCYNPYCAYADGFNCPIPPVENYLQTEVNAGEKTFTH